MRKFSFFLIALMALSFQSLADTVKNGVLQAYWLPQWNNGLNKPKFELRFFAFYDNGKQARVINIDSSDIKENFVKDNFESYSDGFFEIKEGHIEQSGVIRLKELNKTQECDSAVWQAKMVSFERNNKKLKVEEQSGDCGSYPYLISYQLKDGVDAVTLRDKPETEGKVIYRVGSEHSLIKLRNVNSDWLYVAEYDASKPNLVGEHQGYIEYSKIEPLN
ncbi:hypothetical protein [Pantoea vagans]|uniref:hypothetical protein n=1 Tax=Pantoea vagans TaxID=470934 RepID=UPI0023B03715|nr:hypothetical protein [Pantoea vagans]MDE8555297.1 hypothetical protein [Pantoea vagans]MDE8575349.1 hypothetical protein [Pantoea vagans]